MALAIPSDGRLTSQNTLTGALAGSEVMYIVSPGNASQGNSYQIALSTLAGYFSAYTTNNIDVITSGATSGDPFFITTTSVGVLFNKTVSSDSYTVLPLAAAMLYSQSVLIKDLKGDADSHPITVNFTASELCDGLTQVTINTAYGWVRITPVPGGGAWYLS